MAKLPKATKTQMITFLREKGFEVPNNRNAKFINDYTTFWLDWADSSGTWHQAKYGTAHNAPYFMVDQNCIEITWADVHRHGMYRE